MAKTEIEKIAGARTRLLKERELIKVQRLQLRDEVKVATNLDLFLKAVEKTAGYTPAKGRAASKPKAKSRIVDFVIADQQYKGGEEAWTRKIFDIFVEEAKQLNEASTPTEFRFAFLGDEIEGGAAHPATQRQALKEDVITSLFELSKQYAEGINRVNEVITGKHKASLVFTPFSNHGMHGGIGKARYQFPMEDYGRIMHKLIGDTIDKKIYNYPVDTDRFLVETDDTIYLHGHQGYMRSAQKQAEVLGTGKDIYMGHLHHLKVEEEMHRDSVIFPTCRKDLQDYERMAGFKPTPQVSVVIRENGKKTIKRIEL